MRLVGGTRCISFLRKAAGCNFLVANPTNQLFTAFHRGGCHIVQGARMLRLICCLKRLEQRQVCTRPVPAIWSRHQEGWGGLQLTIRRRQRQLLENFWTTFGLLWDYFGTTFGTILSRTRKDGEDGAGWLIDWKGLHSEWRLESVIADRDKWRRDLGESWSRYNRRQELTAEHSDERL